MTKERAQRIVEAARSITSEIDNAIGMDVGSEEEAHARSELKMPEAMADMRALAAVDPDHNFLQPLQVGFVGLAFQEGPVKASGNLAVWAFQLGVLACLRALETEELEALAK